MKLAELLGTLQTIHSTGSLQVEVSGITHDSRRVRPGFLFAALPGGRADGRQFVEDSVRRGAAAVVTEAPYHPSGLTAQGVACVVVPCARVALADLAARFHGDPSSRLNVVGVTGTNGKTTVTYMLRQLLQAEGRRTGLIGTIEYDLCERKLPADRTTPEASDLQAYLAEIAATGARSVVMEVSSHALDQHRTRGIHFDAAVFTNLTQDHLDYHLTLERYFEAKSRLFQDLGRVKRQARAILNTDDPWGARLAESLSHLPGQVLTFGCQGSPSFRAHALESSLSGTRFLLSCPEGEFPVRLPLAGRFNVLNALAATAAASAIGVPVERIAGALGRVRNAPGRMEFVPNARDLHLVVDYAHTDDALRHVLSVLRNLKPRRLLVVFGCGGDRDRMKRPLMGRVAAELADFTVLTSDNPRRESPEGIIRDIEAGFEDRASYEVVVDRRAAIARALELAEAGDTLLVAGKGHEAYQEFEQRVIPFDDRQVLLEILGS